MQDVINKSARIIFFGEVMTLPDGVTVYQVSDDYAQAVVELAEKGDVEIVKAKKKSGKKEQQVEVEYEPEPEVVEEEAQPEPEEVKK